MRRAALYILAGIMFFFFRSIPVHAEEPVIVVLDPGHGGENLGAEYEQYTEKNMTMTVAESMKEELEKYEGVTVYLTRNEDKDMTLEERVDFAKSVNADFLFCLHFNMSEKHDLFGAEVWVSAFDNEYKKGYTFASVEMDMLKGIGLYSRGIKTRLNDEGEDYYGILRHATANDLPSALIEHCHLDQANDKEFYTSEEKLRQFGVLDATAVAKYYGLKSETLGVDYSDYQNVEIAVPTSAVKPDDTEPDICIIDVKDVNEENGDVSVSVSAQDYDSYMLYYSYSFDGGMTFSDLQRWKEGEDTIRFTMNVPSGTLPEVVVRAYNGFDKFTESNHIHLSSLVYGEPTEEAVEASNMTKGNVIEQGSSDTSIEASEGQKNHQSKKEQKEENQITIIYFLQVTLICIAILFVLLVFAMILSSSRSKKKRGRRK
ncbi:MAG: N-acetylmuramoyl-L-alanine amidase [Clostridiales bacterium]|nr:N-acetylmuramoyl-L-alanine amidase [Clostridiales bacterium]